MNSRTGQHKVHDLKSGFGLHYKRQEAILLRAIDMAEKMRAILKQGPFAKTLAKKKNSLIPFQEGIMMSSKAVLMLWGDIKNKYPDVNFIMTARLNQDLVENLFSRLRGLGTSKHIHLIR